MCVLFGFRPVSNSWSVRKTNGASCWYAMNVRTQPSAQFIALFVVRAGEAEKHLRAQQNQGFQRQKPQALAAQICSRSSRGPLLHGDWPKVRNCLGGEG